MGMYTTILHPETNQEIQIKTGEDDLEIYHVGDTVNFWVNENWAGQGKLLDGVYDGWGVEDGRYWAVIKDHKVAGVFDISEDYQKLIELFDIQPPPREWWSEEVWEKDAKLKAEVDAKFDAEVERLEGEYGENFRENPRALAELFTIPLRGRKSLDAIAREIFTIEPMPEPNYEGIPILNFKK